MIVCHCHGVTDRRIREAIREGACTRAGVARACGAGRSCGGCAPLVQEILATESERDLAPPVPAAAEPALATS